MGEENISGEIQKQCLEFPQSYARPERKTLVTYKSCLRYPGGKTRAAVQIIRQIPQCREFREVMVGGGSIFLEAMRVGLAERYWINDLSPDLYSFWRSVAFSRDLTVKAIRVLHSNLRDLQSRRAWYDGHKWEEDKHKDILCAVKFFAVNRMSFSGTSYSGGFSESAALERFTQSSVDRIESLPDLSGINITDFDYAELLRYPGNNVRIFLDPPYVTAKSLYGRNGDLHRFDHERLAGELRRCPHSWIMTYDDCPQIWGLYKDWAKDIKPFNLTYGMSKDKNGKELLIRGGPGW